MLMSNDAHVDRHRLDEIEIGIHRLGTIITLAHLFVCWSMTLNECPPKNGMLGGEGRNGEGCRDKSLTVTHAAPGPYCLHKLHACFRVDAGISLTPFTGVLYINRPLMSNESTNVVSSE
jgi:hypothetical protein